MSLPSSIPATFCRSCSAMLAVGAHSSATWACALLRPQRSWGGRIRHVRLAESWQAPQFRRPLRTAEELCGIRFFPPCSPRCPCRAAWTGRCRRQGRCYWTRCYRRRRARRGCWKMQHRQLAAGTIAVSAQHVSCASAAARRLSSVSIGPAADKPARKRQRSVWRSSPCRLPRSCPCVSAARRAGRRRARWMWAPPRRLSPRLAAEATQCQSRGPSQTHGRGASPVAASITHRRLLPPPQAPPEQTPGRSRACRSRRSPARVAPARRGGASWR